MKYSGVGESESTGLKPRRRNVVRWSIACVAVAALGGPAPDSWSLVFDPRYAAKLAK